MNPDGVIIGNYRTSFSGADLNRRFKSQNFELYPEVHNLKKLIYEIKEKYGDNAIAYFDFHGHSIKRNIFIYGPEFPIGSTNYY